jgi:hypothetical protein
MKQVIKILRSQKGMGLGGSLALVAVGTATLYTLVQLAGFKDTGEIKQTASTQVIQLVATAGSLVKAGRFNCSAKPNVDLLVTQSVSFYNYINVASCTGACNGFTLDLIKCSTYRDTGDPACPIRLKLECIDSDKAIKITPIIAGTSVELLMQGKYVEIFNKE